MNTPIKWLKINNNTQTTEIQGRTFIAQKRTITTGKGNEPIVKWFIYRNDAQRPYADAYLWESDLRSAKAKFAELVEAQLGQPAPVPTSEPAADIIATQATKDVLAEDELARAEAAQPDTLNPPIVLKLTARESSLLHGVYNSYQDYSELDFCNIPPVGFQLTITTPQQRDFLKARLDEISRGEWRNQWGHERSHVVARAILAKLQPTTPDMSVQAAVIAQPTEARTEEYPLTDYLPCEPDEIPLLRPALERAQIARAVAVQLIDINLPYQELADAIEEFIRPTATPIKPPYLHNLYPGARLSTAAWNDCFNATMQLRAFCNKHGLDYEFHKRDITERASQWNPDGITITWQHLTEEETPKFLSLINTFMNEIEASK